MPDRLLRNLDGKRGAFLMLAGVFYILIGATYEVVETPTRARAFQWLPEIITPQVLGVVWIVGGTVALSIALVSARFSGLERVAFGALMLCPVIWTIIFVGSTITGTHPHGWLSGIMYAFFASTVWVVSDWDNPRAVAPAGKARGSDE